MNRADRRASRRQPRALGRTGGGSAKTKLPFPYSLLANVKLFYFLGILVMLIGLVAGMLVSFGPTSDESTEEEARSERDADEAASITSEEAPPFKTYPGPPDLKINPNSRYMATIETEKGPIRVELFAKDAPQTVNNFVFLAQDGFYDGLGFHYVRDGWIAQTGDPACTPGSSACTGLDGPGYNLPLELNSQKHVAGALAMVRIGDASHGSQFYFTFDDLSQRLDNTDVVFGRIVSGGDILKSLSEANPRLTPPSDRIIRVTIEEQPSS